MDWVGERSFKEGDHVRVRSEDAAVRYRKPHLRTPGAQTYPLTWPKTCPEPKPLWDPDADECMTM